MGTDNFVAVDNNRYESVLSDHQRQSDHTYSCTASLMFTPTLTEDQGSEFNCRVQHCNMEETIEKRTGPLQIIMTPQVIEPVRFSLSDSGEVKCSLTLKRFYPQDISITWSMGEPETELMSDGTPVISEDDGTFDVTSVCTLPRDLRFPVYVMWNHQSVRQPQRTVLRTSDLPWRPQIEELNSSDLKLNTESKIQVKISGYFPDDLSVSWYKKNEETDDLVSVGNDNKYKTEVIGHQRLPDHTYSCTASLIFTPILPEDQRSEFICRVQHPNMEKHLERRIGPLQFMMTPQVIEPVRFSLSDSGEVKCSLTLKRFYPQDITITWSMGEPETELMSDGTPVISEDDGTFDVTSVCTLPRDLRFPVYVMWNHQSVRQPQRTVLRTSDLPWHPQIEELNSSDLKLNTESKIQVKISGYFPEDLTVSWYKKNKGTDDLVSVGNDNKYKTEVIGHQRQTDHTYSGTASLIFTPTLKEDQRSEFMCRVQHPSMEEPIERSIGPLQIMGKYSTMTAYNY
ncbi:PREDICTED: uncharacterized protein LOC108800017 [Nanorana parkeri]|uniref:uncharacterized protein LOC108800017 n=1 Tax=Nanorana parkeri TaxID=125878 RepID=UPI0008545FCD|nr:PREDICTED: uncharacterized protein LOC108800017 [Nanorana parkeri]